MKNLLLLGILFICLFSIDSVSQNIWEPTNGPNGLDIADVVFTSDNVLVVSAKNSGVYFSKDKGLSWQKIYKGLETTETHARTLVAGNDGIVYAVFDLTLYRLEKNSDEWIKLNYTVPYLGTIVTNPQGYLYAINYGGSISYSVDKGENFKLIPVKQFQGFIQALFYGGENNFLVVLDGGGAGIYRMNEDGTGQIGIFWTPNVTGVFWHPAGYLFLFGPKQVLLRMDRDGNNQFINDTIKGKIAKLALNSNGNLMMFTDEGDYESEDYGLTFKKKTTNLYQRIVHKSDVFLNDHEWYVYNYDCQDGEFEKTIDDGNNWISLEHTFQNSLIKDIFIDKLGRIFSKTCTEGKYSYSLDKGNTWQFLNLPSQIKRSYDLVSSSSGSLFIILESAFYKSIDLGKTWNQYAISGVANFDRLKGDYDKLIFAFGKTASFISKDGGENWSPIENTPSLIDRLYFHPDGTVFAISYDDLIPGFYFTEDEGLHWKPANPDFLLFYSFAISKKGTIYFSGSTASRFGLFKSDDKLKTYSKLKSDVYKSILTDDNESIYGAFESKCEISTDGGKSWDYYQTGLPLYRFYNSLAIDDQEHLYIAVDNELVYKTTRAVTNTIENNKENLNAGIIMKPNPVENKLNISISDESISSGYYKIFNQNGIEKSKGEFHSRNFIIDCSGLANGMAFIQIVNEKKLICTKKIIIRIYE